MWLDLQIFGFRALWSPYYLTFIIACALVYFLINTYFRKKAVDAEKATGKQQLLFYGGLFLTYILKGSPIDLLSHIMMSIHMLQSAILYLVVPIMLIRGMPNWVWRKVLALPIIKPVFKLFTMPLIALALFNASFSLYHIPGIFDFTKSNFTVHVIVNIVLFVLAVFMWWPLVTPLEEHDKLNPLLKIGFLLISIFIISIACAMQIFSNVSIYQAYGSEGAWIQAMSLCVPPSVLAGISDTLSGPEMFSGMSIFEDQQLGGIVMMFAQQIIYGFVIAWIFFNWFTEKSLQIDPMPTSTPEKHQ